MDDGMRLAPALAKAGRDAVVDGADAARRFGRDLMGGAPKSPAETVLDQIGGNPDLQEAARRSEVGMPRSVAAARDDSVVASLDPYNPADLPPPIPLDEKGLFGRGGLVDHDRYPNLYRTELPNGATALYDGVFQATRLSDPDFFNDLKDVMQAVDDAGHRRPVEVVTRSGKTVTGQSLPPGAEAQAYRMDDLVAKVKRDDVARDQSPTDKMMAVQDLQNSPEAAKWEHEAGLEIGDVLFALTGPEDARRSSDLLIQPYYPSESRGPLVGVDEAGTALEQLQTALDRAGHRGVRIDDGGSNIATTGDRHVFFDPVARRAREQNDRKNAWVERRDRY
jgi:hypothetical protein